MVLAVILVATSLPYINELSQRNLSLPLFSDLRFFVIVITATIIVGIASGLYPAAYLSSFQPVKVLKGSVQTGKNKGLLRNVLVVCQFTSAIFLMIATIFVVRQLNYMQAQDPGFTKDQVLNIALDGIT